MASVIGLDIGGANLKAAHSGGAAHVQGFALWKHAAALPEALRGLLGALPRAEGLAVTMTGELCDCFATKKEGVRAILAAVAAAAGNVPVRVWRNDGRLVSLAAAQEDPLPAAAANWLALATWAGRFAPRGPALLIDVGSTTTDLVPLQDGAPTPRGRTDPDRLRCRELVYTGARRTPLCALLGGAGAAELFATTLDVYLVLGLVDEQPTDMDTADGRPATVAAAHARLARMFCADTDTSTATERLALAQRLANQQVVLVREAIQAVSATLPGRVETIILSGSGELVARRALGAGSPPTLALPPKGGGDQSLVSLAQAKNQVSPPSLYSGRGVGGEWRTPSSCGGPSPHPRPLSPSTGRGETLYSAETLGETLCSAETLCSGGILYSGETLLSLTQELGPERSAAACAYALAVLSAEGA